MKPLCDIQYTKPKSSYRLSKVGIKNVKKPVHVKRKETNQEELLSCVFNVFVDLPAVQKGSHLSRNLEVLREVIDEGVSDSVNGVDDLAVEIGKKLLEKHEYAENASVEIYADYFREETMPDGKKAVESYRLIGMSDVPKKGKARKTLGAEVVGMTVCPCAQAVSKELLGFDEKVPMLSHNQRNVCTATLTMDENISVEANDVIDLILGCFSSPTYEILKRKDEAQTVIDAHKNPKFVEDVARDVLKALVKKYKSLPDDTVISVRSESEESIHKHNAYAERTATLGELK